MSAPVGSREHYDLLEQFEREHRGRRLDREDKAWWPRGHVYQDGATNELFRAYEKGYALGMAVARLDGAA